MTCTHPACDCVSPCAAWNKAAPIVVQVNYCRVGERWHTYRFKVERFKEELILYGATQKEAEEKLHVQLTFIFGQYKYSIKVLP